MHHLSDTTEVAEYVSGELAPRRMAAIDAHLMRCPECRDLVADYRRRARRRATMMAAGMEPLPDTGGVALIGTRRRMVSNAVPVVGSLLTVIAFVAVLVAAWNAGGAAAKVDLAAPTANFTQSGIALSDYDIAELRRHGWTCPDLRPEGLVMTSSTGTRQGDTAWVTITYTGSGGAVVLSEKRNVADPSVAPAEAAEGDQSTTFRVGAAVFALHSSLEADKTAAVRTSVTGIAEDADSDAQAGSANGWERLSRGFARLVDPNR